MKKITALVLGISFAASSALFAADMDHSSHANMNHSNHDSSSSISKSSYHSMQEKDGYDVMMVSEKPLVSGDNSLVVTLKQNGIPIEGAKVRVKFFMPAMPGMPYMEYKADAHQMGDIFHLNIHLAMGGTWQYHLEFKTADGKVHKIRGSVNI